nr:type II toxin-antitoxin system RelE/ParE family toxin [Methyloversatilis sp. XJ19-49]
MHCTVITNVARFRRIGRRYLNHPPQSVEALTLLAAMPTGAADSLREYLHGDYLLLYTVADDLATVYLLTIRHHR